MVSEHLQEIAPTPEEEVVIPNETPDEDMCQISEF